jgi:hypothetical protein
VLFVLSHAASADPRRREFVAIAFSVARLYAK